MARSYSQRSESTGRPARLAQPAVSRRRTRPACSRRGSATYSYTAYIYAGQHPQSGDDMSVRQSLLAILDQGPCYGYQLRAEFDRRTGSTWPLNVGQIYNTLDRLERDGLVTKGDADEHGHVYWEITDAGAAEVRDWLSSPVERAAGTRDELAVKLAVAATLPGVDVGRLIETERRASLGRLHALAARKESAEHASAQGLAHSLLMESMVFAA